MSEEQMITEEQRLKFSALFLEKFGIRIDTDNELLPLYFMAYHSSVVANKNNKKVYENVDKMLRDFKEKIETTTLDSEKHAVDKLEKIDKVISEFEACLARHNENLEKTIGKLDKEMVSKFTSFQARQYHFSSSGQAFWYSFSKFGLPVIISSLLLFMTVLMFIDKF